MSCDLNPEFGLQYSPKCVGTASARFLVDFNETEGATDGKFSLNHRLLEHCTTLAVGADTEWVEQVHRKAHRRGDPATRQWPRYHSRVETGCL